MGVYIKDMEMPTGCLSCDFCNPFVDEPYCRRLMRKTPKTTRLDNCPIVPVPPHGRLIDADMLKEHFPHDEDWDYPVNTNSLVNELIDAVPTIMSAEKEK